MPNLRALILVCIIPLSCSTSRCQDKEPTFPTDEEIKLVLTQTNRAIEQYKPLIDMEEKLLGKPGTEAVINDRDVVRSLELALRGFGKNPKAFNSSLGFGFFEWLDDASRNAALCSSNAMSDAVTSGLLGEKERVDSDIQLSQSCINVSTLFYTVSENAGALYTRYLQGVEKLAAEGAKVAQECGKALKQKGVTPKQ